MFKWIFKQSGKTFWWQKTVKRKCIAKNKRNLLNDWTACSLFVCGVLSKPPHSYVFLCVAAVAAVYLVYMRCDSWRRNQLRSCLTGWVHISNTLDLIHYEGDWLINQLNRSELWGPFCLKNPIKRYMVLRGAVYTCMRVVCRRIWAKYKVKSLFVIEEPL